MSAFQINASDLDRLVKQTAEAKTVVRGELLTAMRATGLDAERYAKTNVRVFRGDLRRSITSKASPTATGAQALVGSNKKYAEPVEKGRRPGATQPPIAAITPWANAHGIDPFVLARSIRRKGIPARPYLQPAAQRAVAESSRHMTPAIARIGARIFA